MSERTRAKRGQGLGVESSHRGPFFPDPKIHAAVRSSVWIRCVRTRVLMIWALNPVVELPILSPICTCLDAVCL